VEKHPLIAGWRQFIEDYRFPVAATLHEDYDANGIYLYELNPRVGHSYGEPLLQKCEQIILREWRDVIEGRRAKNAIVRRTRGVPKLEGMPEAVTLFAEQGCATLTFETPSEFGLFDRVRAHKAFVAGLFEATR
jgi:murein peptide amidase A